ncbi:MAG: deoxyribonuclease V [Synergistales bacterium]|nr:deoxyribonuclease V [Synergistales bacterium]
MLYQFSSEEDNFSYHNAAELQKQLAEKVRLNDFYDQDIRIIAGTDVSYSRNGKYSTAVAGIIIMKYGSWEVIEAVYAVKEISFPYIPGLLSFRELPVLLDAYDKMKTKPDIWLVDGAGIAHPRRLGLASHFGVTIDRPTIGVAKSRLTGHHMDLYLEKGSTVPLRDRAEVIGTVLRSRTNVRPLYISPGHLVSLEQASEIVLSCCTRYRLPEPIRAAHNFVTRLKAKILMQ